MSQGIPSDSRTGEKNISPPGVRPEAPKKAWGRFWTSKETKETSTREVGIRILALFGIQTKAPKRELTREKFRRAVKKAAIIGKGSTVPGVKIVYSGYWQEILLPGHPSVEITRELFKQWNDNSSTKRSFEDWLEEKGYSINSHVQYLDVNDRKEYEVTMQDGKLVREGVPYSTLFESTGFSGPNFAIFVISPDEKLYTGSHIVGEFHHSSFLSGGPVKSAGELRTNEEGQITIITSKSGHYRPGKEDLVNALGILRKKGVDISLIEVRLLTPDGYYSYADAGTFLENPDVLPTGWGPFTFERDNQGMINKVKLENTSIIGVSEAPAAVRKLLQVVKVSEDPTLSLPIPESPGEFREYPLHDFLKEQA